MQSDLLQMMLNEKHMDQLHRDANNERLANAATSRAERRHLGRKIVSIVVSSFQAFSFKHAAQTDASETAAVDVRKTAEISALS